MTWQQIICASDAEHQEAISELLEAAGAVSITLQDAADQPVLEPLPGETPLWDELTITALYPADADLTAVLLMLEAQRERLHLGQLQVEQLEDRPWVREWMDNFHPMQFGKRLWIYPSWCEAPDDDAVKILLDPGLAFGTGNHPTTALCLQWLDGAELAGKSVLDYGCGSGILAIAAAKLGARQITATDIDPQALEATQENARRNDIVPELISTCLPEQLDISKYDVVLANILAGPLVFLAEDILSRLYPGGQLVLSGILAEQTPQVNNAYSSALADLQTEQLEDWIRLSGIKKTS